MHHLHYLRTRVCLCWCLLSLFLCISCGFDATPLYQQVAGTWQLVALDDLIADTIPERLPREDVTLVLTAQATYTQTFSVGNNNYSGIYAFRDARFCSAT